MMGGEGASSSAALADAAHELGTNLGIQARRQAGARAGRDRLLAEAAAVLNDCGFEAAREDACLCLRNCPFSPLSGQFTEVVCALNLSLMQGVISGLRVKGMEAALAPSPERCCVVFQPASRTSPS